jgi:amidophosphoribosyltransferase
VALDAVGAQYVRDILGEIIYTNENEPGKLHSYMVDEEKGKQRICSFEYIYFARPDSTLENINVYEIRKNLEKKSGNRLLWKQML